MDVFKAALATAGFIGGPMVEGFERDFAQFCDAKYCVGVSSGTDALRFALTAAGVNPGDVVLTVPLTFIATGEAISQAGARLDFIDIDARTYTMDPEKLRQYLQDQCALDPATGRLIHRTLGKPVSAVVPVHLYGQMADMDPILELAEHYNLAVIEDACQAHGAEYFSKKENRWRKAGSMGRAAAFSFYPGKNLGLVAKAAQLPRMKKLSRVQSRCFVIMDSPRSITTTSRDTMAGLIPFRPAFCASNCSTFRNGTKADGEHARKYDELFAPQKRTSYRRLKPRGRRPSITCTFCRWRTVRRYRPISPRTNIDTGIHYPVPLHLQKAYRDLGYKLALSLYAKRRLNESCPFQCFPGLTEADQTRVVNAVVQSVQRTGTQNVCGGAS